ncbi:MAG: hypothetical protein JJE13_08435 [Thermoleophilia bacterium]|nr:hypothetical protein [Thermoleophilia bacterium]
MMLILCLSCVVAATAADQSPPPLPDGIGPSDVPGAEANGLAGEAWQAEQEEDRRREQYLDSPQAAKARKQSQNAYAGSDSASAITDLLQKKFGDQLSALNRDPVRALREVDVEKLYSATAALVSNDGRPEVIDSTVPLRTEGDDGQLAPVDLTLHSERDQFITNNGLVDIALPKQSDDPVHLGSDLTFSVGPAGADTSTTGRLFDGQSELFPQGAGTDQDLILSPISAGVDVASLIRSPAAANSYDLALNLPAGASLTKNDDGSVEAHDSQDVIARVLPPFSTDAQGQDVPSHLVVSGNTISVVTDFKDGDYAMPIYTDPVIDTYNWGSGSPPPAGDSPRTTQETPRAASSRGAGTTVRLSRLLGTAATRIRPGDSGCITRREIAPS